MARPGFESSRHLNWYLEESTWETLGVLKPRGPVGVLTAPSGGREEHCPLLAFLAMPGRHSPKSWGRDPVSAESVSAWALGCLLGGRDVGTGP